MMARGQWRVLVVILMLVGGTVDEGHGASGTAASSQRADTDVRENTVSHMREVSVQIPLVDIFFDYNSSTVKNADKAGLKSIAKDVQRLSTDDLQFTLVGHTDARGPGWYNRILAARRVKAVKEVIKSTLGDSVAIEETAVGERDLLDKAHPFSSTNRHVDVFLTCRSEKWHFCSCSVPVEREKLNLPRQTANIIEEWQVTLTGNFNDAVTSCAGTIFVETRAINLREAQMTTTIERQTPNVFGEKNRIVWKGDVSKGDEVLLSVFSATGFCPIGLDRQPFGIVELEVFEEQGQLFPKVTAGSNFAEVPVEGDKFSFEGEVGNCQINFEVVVENLVRKRKTF